MSNRPWEKSQSDKSSHQLRGHIIQHGVIPRLMLHSEMMEVTAYFSIQLALTQVVFSWSFVARPGDNLRRDPPLRVLPKSRLLFCGPEVCGIGQ